MKAVRRVLTAVVLNAAFGGVAMTQELAPPVAPAEQAAQYAAVTPKTILELQQWRRSVSGPARTVAGRNGVATLVELGPHINTWLLLTLEWPDRAARASYHLENPSPSEQRIDLDEVGVQVHRGGHVLVCDLWSRVPSALDQARRTGVPFAPICEGRLYLRNAVVGRATRLEQVTAFLRSHVWGGERIVGFVREQFYRDAYLQQGRIVEGPAVRGDESAAAPRRALVNSELAQSLVLADELGIELAAGTNRLVPGQWYGAKGQPDVYVSLMRAGDISPQTLASHRDRVGPLDATESRALVYLIAFDLAAFELGFALGTDHPDVGWAPRVASAMRKAGLPGPDGIDRIAPLVVNGMVGPHLLARTVATFTGGFKREHGAFQYGALALQNHGSHYGFVEHGVVLSKLMPGLSTMFVLESGAVEMKTWTSNDDRLLGRVRHARQNGVPLIEHDPSRGLSVPGELVTRWGQGNWSGSAEGRLRSLRAGACVQETGSRRFLVYGYFSSATPSAMVRIFQAYDCRYAMHLDMNALEHTYLALYVRKGEQIGVQHLIEGMSQLDQKVGGKVVPRFLGYPDNRDFFYLVRR